MGLHALSDLLKGISMTTYRATRSTSGAIESTSLIGSSSLVAIGCWSTTKLEIGVGAIGTGIKIGVL